MKILLLAFLTLLLADFGRLDDNQLKAGVTSCSFKPKKSWPGVCTQGACIVGAPKHRLSKPSWPECVSPGVKDQQVCSVVEDFDNAVPGKCFAHLCVADDVAAYGTMATKECCACCM